MDGPSLVRYLNAPHDLDSVGWDSPAIAKLWRYNLHYFDDLNARNSNARTSWHRALINRWIEENPVGSGSGWEPYPTSLRIVNWVKWLVGGQVPAAPWLDSVATQARWLSQRLEWHLLGNHLFVNAKALMFAGAFFEGKEAEKWWRRGARIVEAQLTEQILGDGGHFERSPMYHDLFLEDVLDLINMLSALDSHDAKTSELSRRLRGEAARMLKWARALQHPDGRLAMFNDSAHGIAPDRAELERYAADLGVPLPTAPAEGLILLRESGYIRLSGNGAVALLDVAPVGPDYLPGHAHADTLSFELSIADCRLVVNGGTSVYGTGTDRAAERSTSAHSTVELDGLDSSEVWGGFRVGRRARPFGLSAQGHEVACSHDGYRHLPGSPVVSRRWTLNSTSLTVADEVSPERPLALSRFLMGPGVTLHFSDGSWHAIRGGQSVARISVEEGEAQVAKALHAQEFGSRMPVDCLVVKLKSGRSRTTFAWS